MFSSVDIKHFAGDFRLQAGSPAVDKGLNWLLPPDVADADDDGSTIEVRGDEMVEYDGEMHTAANLHEARLLEPRLPGMRPAVADPEAVDLLP